MVTDMTKLYTMVSKLVQKRRTNRRRTPLRGRKRRRRDQTGGFLPALIPLLALAGKAVALGALSGAAGFGVKKALAAASK